jgi:hypothetical protein
VGSGCQPLEEREGRGSWGCRLAGSHMVTGLAKGTGQERKQGWWPAERPGPEKERGSAGLF